MDLYKHGHFCSFFFVGNMGQENVLYIFLEQKKRLSKAKNQKVQKVKKLTFFQRG